MAKTMKHPPDERLLRKPRLTILDDGAISPDDPNADQFDLISRVGPLYDMLRHPRTHTPMTAAIYGDWGTGQDVSNEIAGRAPA